jgi:hypothetical protein
MSPVGELLTHLTLLAIGSMAALLFAQCACLAIRIRRALARARRQPSSQLDWKTGGYIDPARGPGEAEPDEVIVRSVHGIFVRIR